MRKEEQKQADRKARMEEAEEKQLEYDEKMARLKKNNEVWDWELNHLRVQKHREKKKAEKDGAENANTMLMDQARKQKELAESENDAEKVLGLHGVAEVSRVTTSDWQDSWNGTLGGAKQGQAERTNWYHPFLWVHIAVAMIKADWSSCSVMFLTSSSTFIVEQFTSGRSKASGNGRSRHWKRSNLETFTSRDRLQCSERYVRQFFQAILNWSPHAGTRAAAHLPTDAEDVCECSLMQIVYAMQWYNIPPKLLLNSDQMGIYVLPNSFHTYHPTGEKQVNVVAKDEKRPRCWNTTPECLTSKKTQAELRKYLQQDSTLREEIEAQCGIVHGLNDSSEPLESDIDLRIDSVDDDDVPLTAVISATFGETLNDTNFQKMEEGTLENNIEVEDVWAYNGAGRMWSETGNLPQEDQDIDDNSED
ncbi:hypothetical protein K435DRAFT_868108 [Dendrothele bispora CBS 962.96]|uniref:Uncharacterized protein n=1 Tax=Dendrothele bispora (strain CBS 962.96) TaxID=1314807 RepID=A0A4S8LD18_DENBC|nr:hypothetical protein K435DRAFT_868108 [Dendrothele bispora CBS 962.96]